MSETNDQRIYDRCIIRVGQLEAENAKLRELVLDMWCDSVTRMSFADRHAFIDKFIDRTRELGIEVGDGSE